MEHNISIEDKSIAFRDGYQTYLGGGASRCCPYIAGSSFAFEWKEGWFEAQVELTSA